MKIFNCSPGTVLDVGDNITIRIVTVRNGNVCFEIDAPHETRFTPEIFNFEEAIERLKSENFSPTAS